MSRGIPVVLLALGLTGTLWACDGGGLIEDAGEALMDAGEALRDGALSDGMVSDASAQMTTSTTVACDIERTRVVTNTFHTSTTTIWYAELRDPAIAPGTLVRAEFCGLEEFGVPSGAPEACPGVSTCSGDSTTRLPALDCVAFHPEFEGGVARAYCGTRSEVVYADGTTPTSLTGNIRRTATFFVTR